MDTNGTSAAATAPASPAASSETTPAASAPAEQTNGSAPPTGNADADLPRTEDGEIDYAALLDRHGSKLDVTGQPESVDLNTPIVAGEAPAKPAASEAANAPEATPAPAAAAAAPITANDDEIDPATGEPKTEANNFRLNIRDHKDAGQIRTLLRLIKNEPGASLAALAQRAGVSLATAKEAAAAPATSPSNNAPTATAPAALQTLRDELAELERKETEASDTFQFDQAIKIGKDIRSKQRDLDRLEAQAEAERNFQAQKVNEAVESAWKDINQEYPDVGVAGSALNKAVQARMDQIQARDAGFFDRNPDYPVQITLTEARRLKIAPKAPAAPAPAATNAPAPPAAAAPAPVVQPKKPSAPVPPPPATGSTGAVAPPDTAAWDPAGEEDIFSFLDRKGTKITTLT